MRIHRDHAYVNDRDRPLAFYPFTNDKRLAERTITEVLSSSVSVNEAIVQVGQHALPFGGVGASGMGPLTYTAAPFPTTGQP